MSDNNRGLYGKYLVERVDGQAHKGEIFVLCSADKHALPALLAYADSCEAEYPLLALDLRELVAKAKEL